MTLISGVGMLPQIIHGAMGLPRRPLFPSIRRFTPYEQALLKKDFARKAKQKAQRQARKARRK